MKNVLLKVSLFIICIVPITVYGVGSDGGGGGSGSGGGQATSGFSQDCVTSGGSCQSMEGVRVSLVDMYGKDIGKTVDFVVTSDLHEYWENGFKFYTQHVQTTNRSPRMSYLSGESVTWHREASFSNFAVDMKRLNEIFQPNPPKDPETGEDYVQYSFGFDFNYMINVLVNGKTRTVPGMDNVFDGIRYEGNEHKYASVEEYKAYVTESLNGLLGEMNAGQLDDYIVKSNNGGESFHNVFFIFEPLARVEVGGVSYWGTSYELGHLDPRIHAQIPVIVDNTLPCTSYLSGDLYNADLMQRINDSELTRTLTPYAYFNTGGTKLQIPTADMVHNRCSRTYISGNPSTYLQDWVTVSDQGAGIGVIWPTSLISAEKEEGCDMIKENLIGNSWTSLEAGMYSAYMDSYGTIASTEFSGYNLDSVINYVKSLYPNGIIYDKDGETKTADVNWFIDNCSCFGVFDAYQDDALRWATGQLDYIDKVNNILAYDDWFKLIEAEETKAKIITPFLEVYNGNMERKYLNSDPKWETITWETYESMECPNPEAETYWCEEVEVWYEDNRRDFGYPALSTYGIADGLTNIQLEGALDAYNLIHYKASGFFWNVGKGDHDRGDSGFKEFDYVKACLGDVKLNCDVINEYYLEKGHDLPNYSVEQLEKFSFDEYNKAYNQVVTGYSYIEACADNDIDPKAFNCTPDYGVGTCIDGDIIHYADSEQGTITDDYWENCVFNDYGEYEIRDHKWANKYKNYTYYDNTIWDDTTDPYTGVTWGSDNDFCPVYCIEDMTAQIFNPEGLIVEAGEKFTLPENFVIGNRTCKTKKYDWALFETTLANNNAHTARQHAEWQVEVKHAAALRGPEVIDDGCIKSCNSKGECTYENQYIAKWDGHSTEGQYVGGGSVSWCASDNPTPPSEYDWDLPDRQKQEYLDAVEIGKSTINEMNACFNWIEEEIYTIDPNIAITYENEGETTTYEYSEQLKRKDIVYESENNINTCIDRTKYNIIDCPTGGNYTDCKEDSHLLKQCDEFEYTRSASTSFELEENVFNWVLKDINKSVSSLDGPGKYNYIDLKGSFLPVAYSTLIGLHGTTHGTGKLDYRYENLGHMENGRTQVDGILATVPEAGGNYTNWICEYEVVDDLINEKDDDETGKDFGITIIYRPIDLDNPFPDINSEGRMPGNNWQYALNAATKESEFVSDYILNNREVTSEALYGLEPMYTFVLTPAIINEIRDYNENNDYGNFEGNLTNASGDACSQGECGYVCEKGTGRACVSDYLTHLIDITGAANQPGVCVQDQFRNPNNSADFYECRFETWKGIIN